jgi:hypothetical protein
MDFTQLIPELFKGLANFSWGNAVMFWMPAGKYSA